MAVTESLFSLAAYDPAAINDGGKLVLNELLMPPTFRISVGNQNVIAASQILDGPEVYERMSRKAAQISINGTVYVDETCGATDESGLYAYYLSARKLFDEKIIAQDAIIAVENDMLNSVGVNYLVIGSVNCEEVIGQFAFRYTISARGAETAKTTIEETSTISQ